jgi:alpha-mannosidase
MSVSLIRNSIDPENCPENTTHNINVKISAVQFSSNLELLRQAERQRTPISYISVKAGNGNLPLTNSLVDVKGGMLTSFKAVDDGYVLRLVECDGNSQIIVNLNGVKSAVLCNGIENELKEIEVKNNKFSVAVTPFSVTTVKVKL